MKDNLEELIEWFEVLFIPGLCGFGILFCLFIGWLIYMAIQDNKSPTFTLKKTEWTCVSTVPHETTVYIQTGKYTTVPVTTVTDECTLYKRNY